MSLSWWFLPSVCILKKGQVQKTASRMVLLVWTAAMASAINRGLGSPSTRCRVSSCTRRIISLSSMRQTSVLAWDHASQMKRDTLFRLRKEPASAAVSVSLFQKLHSKNHPLPTPFPWLGSTARFIHFNDTKSTIRPSYQQQREGDSEEELGD